MESAIKAFGADIRAERALKNMTQTELATACRVSANTMNQWEHDRSFPSEPLLKRLLKVLPELAPRAREIKAKAKLAKKIAVAAKKAAKSKTEANKSPINTAINTPVSATVAESQRRVALEERLRLVKLGSNMNSAWQELRTAEDEGEACIRFLRIAEQAQLSITDLLNLIDTSRS